MYKFILELKFSFVSRDVIGFYYGPVASPAIISYSFCRFQQNFSYIICLRVRETKRVNT